MRKIFALGMLLLAGFAVPAAAQQGSWDSWYTIADAAAHNDTRQVEGLLAAGGRDPDAIESQDGRTALDWAAAFDNLPMAQLLLRYGAHIDARDKLGNTALHYAAERGRIDFMRFLIAQKATIDAGNRQGLTPLMIAAQHGQAAAARLLLASGADPRKQDFTGRDAIGWAAENPAVQQVFASKP